MTDHELPTMGDAGLPDGRTKSFHAGFAQRYAALEQHRRVAFFVSVAKRFNDIDGGNQAAVLSVTLFTTVLPLIILGFAYLSGFADNVSVGVMFERELGLPESMDQVVHSAFGSAARLRSSWTVVGLAGFLVWGIPMAATVAGIFAKAWRCAPLSLWQRVWRGTTWFALYLVTLAVHDRIAFSADHLPSVGFALFCAALLPIFLFWSATPALLLRDGGKGARLLVKAGITGLTGLAIDGILLSAVQRLVFPPMLTGWTGFGPMGVAMTIVTWCAVIGVGWVLTACISAVLCERSAPPRPASAAESDLNH